jgi:hypothetical protein
MKRIYTPSEIISGRHMASRLSDKARNYYSTTDPIFVAEYKDEDGSIRYAYGEDHRHPQAEGLTLEQLDRAFCEAADELAALDEED